MLAAFVFVGFSVASFAADAKPAEKPAEPKPADPAKKDPATMKADEANEAGLCPICKGEFKPVYHYEYKGKEYHFRTRKCCQEFIADPTKFGAVGETWKSSLPPAADPTPPPKKK